MTAHDEQNAYKSVSNSTVGRKLETVKKEIKKDRTYTRSTWETGGHQVGLILLRLVFMRTYFISY